MIIHNDIILYSIYSVVNLFHKKIKIKKMCMLAHLENSKRLPVQLEAVLSLTFHYRPSYLIQKNVLVLSSPPLDGFPFLTSFSSHRLQAPGGQGPHGSPQGIAPSHLELLRAPQKRVL